MDTERTLVLIKPDGVVRGLIGDVVGRIERKGLRLVALDLRTLDRETAQTHYAEHREKPFFGPLVDFITSGPLVAAVVEGPRAIEAFRQLAGARGGASCHADVALCLRGHTVPIVTQPRHAWLSDKWLPLSRVPREQRHLMQDPHAHSRSGCQDSSTSEVAKSATGI